MENKLMNDKQHKNININDNNNAHNPNNETQNIEPKKSDTLVKEIQKIKNKMTEEKLNDGIAIIDKPIGMTSFDVIREARKTLGIKKIGHIGTLDPLASGVLPILVGNATKLSDYLMEHYKEYIATIKLGEKRSTGDSDPKGTVLETKNVPEKIFETSEPENSDCTHSENKNVIKNIKTDYLNKADVNIISSSTTKNNLNKYALITEVLKSFLGESEQIPPMYSAIKINGKKLYEYARNGENIERKPRKINVSSIELLDINKNENTITYKVNCSKGTYIRVLCEDIAEKLGTVGYMESLRRTRVGNFKLEEAGTFIPLGQIFPAIPRITVDASHLKQFINGVPQPLPASLLNSSNKTNTSSSLCYLYTSEGFIGIGEINNKTYKRKILIN